MTRSILRTLAALVLLCTANAHAAIITSHEDAGQPLTTGSAYFFGGALPANTSFHHAVIFSTDSMAGSSSAAVVGLDLTGISGFVGPITIGLYEGLWTTGSDTAAATMVGAANNYYLWNLPVSPLSEYTFVISGQTAGTPLNLAAGVIAVSAVPLPGAAWLFASALAGLGLMRRRPA